MDKSFTDILNTLSPTEQSKLLNRLAREVKEETYEKKLTEQQQINNWKALPLEDLEKRLKKLSPRDERYSAVAAAHKAKLAEAAPVDLGVVLKQSEYAAWEKERESLTAVIEEYNNIPAAKLSPADLAERKATMVKLAAHMKTKPDSVVPDPEPEKENNEF